MRQLPPSYTCTVSTCKVNRDSCSSHCILGYTAVAIAAHSQDALNKRHTVHDASNNNRPSRPMHATSDRETYQYCWQPAYVHSASASRLASSSSSTHPAQSTQTSSQQVSRLISRQQCIYSYTGQN